MFVCGCCGCLGGVIGVVVERMYCWFVARPIGQARMLFYRVFCVFL